jgi:hypothetical protein
MLIAVAALAIGAPFPFDVLTGPDGKPLSAAWYRGKYVAVLTGFDSEPALLAQFSGVTSEEKPLAVIPAYKSPKAGAVSLKAGALPPRALVLANPSGLVVKWWGSPTPASLREWLEGSSLPPGAEAPDPYNCLRVIPALPMPNSWWELIAQAALLLSPPRSEAPKTSVGYLTLFLSSTGAADKIYEDRIAGIAAKCKEAGIPALAVFSGYGESVASVFAFANRVGLRAALDPGCAIADAYRATRTPEAFLLDKNRRVVYAGAIDSATWETSDTTPYLSNAISSLARGEKPKVAQTMPFGGVIRRGDAGQVTSLRSTVRPRSG